MGKKAVPKKTRPVRRRDEGSRDIDAVTNKYDEFDPKAAKTFEDFPLSYRTLAGLAREGFLEPTDIQRESIGLALRGCDVLGAAMTGSGKTLAFLIPILEILWRERWSRFDGVGSLIISPTRELAMQTYEVLRKVGSEHDFSAALIVGGTDVNYEAKRLAGKNIIVGTPGRILQHMDENASFNCDNMKALVIDEADRLLDMGFEGQLNAIISHLPSERQTLLFSATQTKSVKDLARLSLKDPVYVSVHEHAKYSTPEQLKQSYTISEDNEKFNMLWSFVKNHQQAKTLVFMANCKQVRFAYEAFKRLRAHTTILCLHGSMAQMKRVNVYEQFCNKKHAVLLATDIAARGLDFPAVDWVLQLDCPPDANEYIHRCGRTARYRRDGKSLLILTPSQESAMIEDLKSKKIPITKITINPSLLVNVEKKLVTFCSQDAKFKTLAQRAFVSYIRSIFLMSNKNVFDVKQINYDAMAKSYGLAVTPRVRFLRKQGSNGGKTASVYSKPANPVNEMAENDSAADSSQDGESTTILEIAARRTNEEFSGWGEDDGDDDDDDTDLLVVKKRDVFKASEIKDHKVADEKETSTISTESKKSANKKLLTREAVAKKILRKRIVANKKLTFDDEGQVANPGFNTRHADLQETQSKDCEDGYSIDVAKKLMEAEDETDRRNYRKRIRDKHREEKRKRKLAEMEKRQQNLKGKAGMVLLASNDNDEGDELASGSLGEGGDDASMSIEGERESSDQEGSVSSEEGELGDPPPRKKKRLATGPTIAQHDEDRSSHPHQAYSHLTLEDAEKLALRLIDA